MFEDLKERQRGFRPKEKARLYVTVAACPVKALAVDRLWSFALEGADGKRIVVVHPGLGTNPAEDKPADAYHPGTAPVPLENGDLVRVRGIYLQRRTGTVGAVALGEPTPV